MLENDLGLLAGVTLHARNIGKYLIVEVKNEKGESRHVVIGGSARQRHFDLLRDFRYDVQNSKLIVTPLGGGRFNVFYDEPKRVYLWYESAQYGPEPNRAESIRLFAEAFPGFSVGFLTPAQCAAMDLDPTK